MTQDKILLNAIVNEGDPFECEMDDCIDIIENGEKYYNSPDGKKVCDACAMDISASV